VRKALGKHKNGIAHLENESHPQSPFIHQPVAQLSWLFNFTSAANE
jgi:hypothetical protein